MNTQTDTRADLIQNFASAVRAELADLPDDDVEDLVGGLVGDLTDRAEDDGEAFDPGDPVAYASELRSAAGLPDKQTGVSPKVPLRKEISQSIADITAEIRRSPAGAWVLDLFESLRPAGWVIRGLVMYFLLITLVTHYDARSLNPITIAIASGVILVSVQWGRGRWLPKNFMRHIRTLASVVAVVAFLPLFGWLLQPQYVGDDYYEEQIRAGLLLDGVQIGNLFAYDANGELIEEIQLFTDRGTPVNLYGAQDPLDVYFNDEGLLTIPSRDLLDKPLWNIYPLDLAQTGTDGGADLSTQHQPEPPFARVPDRTVTPAPTSGPTATPSPEPTSESGEILEPTPTPTP